MSSRTRLLAYPVAVLLSVLLFTNVLRGQSGVQYFYDPLGRLVGVIDTSGNAAAYSYDPVGNLLAITRYTAGQASVLDFTPSSGPVGTVVTISGTGYSTTASQDTVSFNGTTATITSATVNQIIATVPTGATTGPIKVTSPAGTFTTATSFTVTTGTGVPTITSFTPAVATPGTALTITGTNFDTNPINDKLIFNGPTQVQVQNPVTSTTISTTMPSASASGHISINTPGGVGVSSQDLYVPFGTHVAGDVLYTARTTLGGTATVGIGTANKIGLLLFDASSGQRVSLSLSGSNFSSCTIYLISPNNIQLTSSPCTASTTFVDTANLTNSGTYTVGVDPQGSVGSLTVTVNNASNVTGTITAGGSAVTATTTVPGQDAVLTFSGTANQRVSLLATNVTTPAAYVNLATLIQAVQAQITISSSCGTTCFMDTQTLPNTGTYTIWVQHINTNTGSQTLQLYNVPPDVTEPITPSGSAVTVTTTVPGQDTRLTFTGTTNQRVSVLITNVTTPDAYLNLVQPSGTTQSQTLITPGGCGSAGCFVDTQTLATAGGYDLWVQHSSNKVGSETIQLYNVPADASGTVTIGGSPASVSTTVPGQNANLTFSGASGQKVSLNLTSGTYSVCNLSLINPDGTTLTTDYGGCSGSTDFVNTVALTQTGTYTIFIDPQGTATGGVTVQVNNDSDITGTITPGGSPVTVTTTVPGQDARLTFTGTANQHVSLLSTSVTTSTYLNLVQPNGTTQTDILSAVGCSNPGCFMDTQTLATSGTYTIWVQHNNSTPGSETLKLYNVTDATGTITIGGSSITFTTSTPGQNAEYTFSGTSGQSVTVHLTSDTFTSVGVSLIDPNGVTLTTGYGSANSFNLTSETLSTTGTYTVKVDPLSSYTGTITVNVTSP
jgi:YD repeat-containing protein